MQSTQIRDNRVVQYLRMSTEHQRYSLENQAAANALYAEARGLEIVRTYTDSGRSGLTLRGRDGLKSLLADTLSGSPGFSRVLVYDVSRWGRFQDPDQSAHYEFLCRDAGVEIEYCAEQFANDGSLFGTLAKSLKRIMAAEYSRELSAKVSQGQRRAAAKGLWQGGPARFGFRRQLIEEDGTPIAILRRGQRKSLTTQRVVLIPGPEEELEVVRSIFRTYAAGALPQEIAERLRAEEAPRWLSQAWSTSMVRRILSDEQYTGTQITSKTYSASVGVRRKNLSRDWIRKTGAFQPTVERALFDAVQLKRKGRHSIRDTPEKRQALLDALTLLLKQQGRLNIANISASPTTPSPTTYKHAFGGLNAAYQLIGYTHPRRALLLDDFRAELDAMARRNRTLPPLQRKSARYMLRSLQSRGFKGAISLVHVHLRKGRSTQAPIKHRKLGGMTDEELLAALSEAYVRHGHLSMAIIREDPNLPHPSTVANVFGSMNAAYDLVGFMEGRRTPKIGPYIRQLRNMVEANGQLPEDERLRYVDMYAALQSNGYAGSYTSVRKHALKLG